MPSHLQNATATRIAREKTATAGDEHEIEVDFRLVSATNRDTLPLLDEGLLRKDLTSRSTRGGEVLKC